jgi:putative peptidoglycan lipid II flippase
MLDRVFALGFTVVMSTAFGASKDLDLYLLALAPPAVIAVLIGDLIYSQLLPDFVPGSGFDRVDPRWKVVIWTLVGLSACTVCYASIWVAAVALFESAPERDRLLQLGVSLSPLIFLGGVVALAGTIFVAERAYVAAASRLPIASFVTLLSFFLWQRLIEGVEALAASVLTGSAAAALVCGFIGGKMLGAPQFPTVDDGRMILRRLGRASLAQIVSGVLAQAAIPIERLVGAGVGAGVVSSLNYGRVLVSPPLLLAQSIATASYPRLVEMRANRDPARYRELGRTNGIVVFLLLPPSVLLVMLASPLVGLLYLRGTFDERAAAMTTICAAVLALGLVPIALSAVVTRFLYAEQLSASVARASGFTLAVYLVLAATLAYSTGYAGLAIASVASSLFGLVVLLLAVRGDAYRGWEHLGLPSSLRSATAAVAMCLVTIAMESLLPIPRGLLTVIGASVAGIAAYVGMAVLLKSPEVSRTLALWGRRRSEPRF